MMAQNIPARLGNDLFDEVTAWLGRLVILYGIPFHYLIPEEKMLPGESIRFFYVDPIWIQCLVQGACSIGANGYGDTLIDRTLNETVQPNQPAGDTQASPTNQRAAGVRDRLRVQYEDAALPAESAALDWPLTGFLLRSSVVQGWRGLEIMAYKALHDAERTSFDTTGLTEEQKAKFVKDGVAPLKALRIEQLSRDVMLGIFNGIIAQLIIRQPQEGLHFGLEVDDLAGSAPVKSVSYSKTLRDLGNKRDGNAGQTLSATIDLSGSKSMRDQEQKGVIKIAELAGRMKTVLAGAGQLEQEKFTAAEFAVEMIEAAGEFTFRPAIRTAP
jgi:hypothetical protein